LRRQPVLFLGFAWQLSAGRVAEMDAWSLELQIGATSANHIMAGALPKHRAGRQRRRTLRMANRARAVRGAAGIRLGREVKILAPAIAASAGHRYLLFPIVRRNGGSGGSGMDDPA